MQVFYNREGIGDVLLVQLKAGEKHSFKYESKGNVTKIVHSDNHECLGYNIFDVTKQGVTIEGSGPVEVDEAMVAKIQSLLDSHGFSDHLDVDLSPKVVVGQVSELKPHPNADRLKVCHVDVGQEKVEIVCGAPNVAEGQRVVVAKVGAILPGGFSIKESNLRGVDSYGMICSAKELGLENAPQEKGIVELPQTYAVGSEFDYEGKDFLKL